VSTEIRWLKTSFLVGAVVDAIAGVLILVPAQMGETEFRYSMGLAASLMFGWTLLMLWGYRSPVERKGILPLTIFPVITGILASNVFQGFVGLFPVGRVIVTLVLGVGLIALFGYSYLGARKIESSQGL
jgi:peptidoglycan/LPS O-acetylase OafA/YrhL